MASSPPLVTLARSRALRRECAATRLNAQELRQRAVLARARHILPPVEWQELKHSVGVATGLAVAGRVADGFDILDAGLEYADGMTADGVLWGVLLGQLYQTEMDALTARFGECLLR